MTAPTNAAAINIENTLLRMGPPAPLYPDRLPASAGSCIRDTPIEGPVFIVEGGLEEGETGERDSRAHKGYFTQSPQRAEAKRPYRSARRVQHQRGGGPRYARHGSRGARFTSAAGMDWHL